jgi:hypothetical protein
MRVEVFADRTVRVEGEFDANLMRLTWRSSGGSKVSGRYTGVSKTRLARTRPPTSGRAWTA